jgi:disulfide bond formation protein DsbB
MRQRLILLATALAVVALACGGGDDDSGGETPAPTPTQAPAPDAPATDPAAVAAGEQLFVTCSACHGPDARGIDGLGKSLVGSEFVNALSDTELVDFIKVGRDTSDPLNTTGVAMLPKGGNPALSDADIGDIVAYIRSLN